MRRMNFTIDVENDESMQLSSIYLENIIDEKDVRKSICANLSNIAEGDITPLPDSVLVMSPEIADKFIKFMSLVLTDVNDE